MKRLNNKSKTLIASTFVLSMFLLIGCGNAPNEEQVIKEKIITINAAKVERRTIVQNRKLSGTLEGVEQSSIVSKIAERITDIKVSVNSYIKKSQLAVQLDKTGPSSNYLQTSATLDNAKKDYERMKALFMDGAIAEQQLDQAETGYEVAKANFEASSGTVNLVSPISGIITELNNSAGDWVTPGTQIAVVANISNMIIKFSVSETEMQRIKMGDKVKIYSESGYDQQVIGKVIEISRSASADARSFQVKAKFNNTKDSFYKPGMFVNVEVILNSKQNVLVIPTSAISTSNQKNEVFIIKGDRSYPVEVTTGINDEIFTEILSGLNEGDTIATIGMNNLQDSTKVSIVK